MGGTRCNVGESPELDGEPTSGGVDGVETAAPRHTGEFIPVGVAKGQDAEALREATFAAAAHEEVVGDVSVEAMPGLGAALGKSL